MKAFLCDKVNMKFLTNPGDKETVYPLNCHFFLAETEAYLHLYFDNDLVPEGDSESLLINRTDTSYQNFKISFSTDLEFMDILLSKMYFRHQNA